MYTHCLRKPPAVSIEWSCTNYTGIDSASTSLKLPLLKDSGRSSRQRATSRLFQQMQPTSKKLNSCHLALEPVCLPLMSYISQSDGERPDTILYGTMPPCNVLWLDNQLSSKENSLARHTHTPKKLLCSNQIYIQVVIIRDFHLYKR